MNIVEHVPANFPDKILGEQERNLTDPPVPMSESEYFSTENIHARANRPMPIDSAKYAPINTHEVAPAVGANAVAEFGLRVAAQIGFQVLP